MGPIAALNRDTTPVTSVNNTFKQSHNQVFHNNPQHLNLVSRSGQLQEQNFSVEVAKWLPVKGHQQLPSTSQSGPYLRNGEEEIRWISPLPLWKKFQTFSCTCTKI